MDQHYSVRIGEKTYSKTFQTQGDYATSWKSVLQNAHGTTVFCLCPGRETRKLAVKHRDKTDEYHLARFANTGHEHFHDCHFYAPAPDRSGLQGYNTGVVVEGDDQTVQVRLAHGIREREAGTQPGPVADHNHPVSPGHRKPAMTILGLLHLFWTRARLNVWHPNMVGKRNPGMITYQLRKTAERVSVSGLTLSDVLLLQADKGRQDEQLNREKTAKAAKHHHRLVVIASLSRFDETRADQSVDRLPIAGPFGMPTLNLNAAAWGRVMRSFADELHAWRRHERVIAIAHVGLRSGQVKEADVLDVGLMRVSPRWIPLDSSYEGTIEEKLCQASRKFEKPLRFDADEAEVFPDFWLFDAGKDYPLEVFGMATNDYLARRDHKTAWYNAKYGVAGWWHWDAASDPGAQRIPPFPDPL